jgi:hypothetical protein
MSYKHTLRDPATGQYDENRTRNAFIAYQMWNGVPIDEAKGQWNKMSETQQESWKPNHISPDLQGMFDKEKTEHADVVPPLSDAQLWQIVQDHIKAGVKETQHPMQRTTGPPDAADAGSPQQRHFPPSDTQGYDLTQKVHLRESFSWSLPWKLIAEAGKRLIRGAAITIGKTKNKGTYTKDELMKGARTLAGKPILHNHLESVEEAQAYLNGIKSDGSTFDPAKIPPLVRANIQAMIADNSLSNGEVTDSEFEGDAVEYEGVITRPTAVAMADAGLIKGPSIGAIPRNRDLKNPRGIMFTDISIITDPETPADSDASMKVMEKLREMVTEPSAPVRLREAISARLELNLKRGLYARLMLQEVNFAIGQRIAQEQNKIRNGALSNDEYS